MLSKAMPEESEYLFQTGNAYEQLNNSQQAAHFYSKAIERDADQFLYYFKRGTIFLKQNKLKEAETDFNSSLLINPKHHNSLHNRAIARYKLGEADKACDDWCQSFLLGNSYSESHLKENCKKSQPCIPVK
jgi:tetratricopeptide (TPR) repeat protein